MSEQISGMVVLRFDENGEQTYHVIGDKIRFFIVDLEGRARLMVIDGVATRGLDPKSIKEK